jgi:hypothetical protein
MELIYEYPGVEPRFPYFVVRAGLGSYYKILLRNRFLFVSIGREVLDRGGGKLDIPHVGAERRPVGDFVYATPAEARAGFDRFRAAPNDTLTVVLAGRKP